MKLSFTPKKTAMKKFEELFGHVPGADMVGRRDGKQFVVELVVDGRTLARTAHRDWRLAYKLMQIEIEKMFADGAAVQSR